MEEEGGRGGGKHKGGESRESRNQRERDYMEIICDEERCSLGHGACFACFLIVSVFIIQIYAFNNLHVGHIKGKCVRFF